MRIERIAIRNTIGLRHMDVALPSQLTLFAGPNGAGKTSIAQSIRLSMTAEPSRVSLKKDFDKLITEGSDSAGVQVEADGIAYCVGISAGKVIDNQAGRDTPPALPYVLDMHRFCSLSADERRAFLFNLTGIEITGDAVMARLKERGCDMTMAEEVKPVLRSGFPAAAEYARRKAAEGRGAWRATTGGETWGKDKGGRWRAEKPEADASLLEKARADLETIEAEVAAAATALGELQSRKMQAAQQQANLQGLRQRAGAYARIREKLTHDETELKEWEAEVEETRAKATGGALPAEPILACPHCAGLVLHVNHTLQAYEQPALQPDHEAAASLPEYERALKLCQSTVANDKRDLDAADDAARALAEIESAGLVEPPSEGEITEIEKRIAERKHDKKNQEAGVRLLEEAVRRAADADEKTIKAAVIHKAILDWLAIGDALEPSGIPGELLAEALKPINDRLRHAAEITDWMQTTVGADMAITAGGRPYALLSESEQWRVDAMFTESISHLSGLRLIVLDRMDVLDMPGRSAALLWLHDMAAAGELETGILLATLKTLPANLPDTFRCHWLEGGRVNDMKAAA